MKDNPISDWTGIENKSQQKPGRLEYSVWTENNKLIDENKLLQNLVTTYEALVAQYREENARLHQLLAEVTKPTA